MARVWPETVVGDANLSVTVSALRRGLGRNDGDPAWVETGAALQSYWTRAVAVPASGSPPVAYPAYRALLNFFRTESLPGARPPLAAAALPEGPAYYDALVRQFIG